MMIMEMPAQGFHYTFTGTHADREENRFFRKRCERDALIYLDEAIQRFYYVCDWDNDVEKDLLRELIVVRNNICVVLKKKKA